MSQAFYPSKPDYKLSPFTGMTREGWMEAGKHLLRGIFQNIGKFEDPVVMPRKETKITYPHAESPDVWREAEKRAEIFEGLTRSLFIAAPLLKNEPELEICGYSIADYYKSHILRSCTSGDSVSVGNYEELQEMTGHVDPFRCFQQTVETCALVIGLWAEIYPNFKVAATTLREVHSATVNDWSALCWADGEIFQSKPYENLEIMDRVGGGDSFASGLIYGLMKTGDAAIAVDYGAAHGALAMTTPGDTSMVSCQEVEAVMSGASARVKR